jgi:signal transduction histidine kinase
VISKSLVQAYDGDIMFVSIYGTGTIFSFTFEVDQQELDQID